MLEKIIELKGDIWQVDLEERGIPGWTAGYYIKGEGKSGWMLIETGPASSAERLFDAANIIGISPQQVKHIGVTHIHVDHAGGLGVVSRYFKDAQIWAHPVGERHLVDPTRLIEGSRAVYGEKKMQEYGEVLPVPEGRIRSVLEGEIISLGGRTIEVWETPGHARHHVCFFDHKTKGIFSGDTAGVYAPHLSKLLNHPVARPATPGPDFNGELMLQNLYRLARSEVQNIYYTHFGAASPAQLLLELVIGQLLMHMHIAKDYLKEEDAVHKLGKALQDEIKKGLRISMVEKNIDETMVSNEMKLLMDPLFDSADGLLADLRKSRQ
ncbi:MAG: MBL fold metallo-hydrolase [Bacillota bacterium]|nr:MBL fold metallo-hydrolase [Bacillota bacterium]